MYSVKFNGASGKDYSFVLHEIDALLPATPALYVAMKLISNNPDQWKAIYFGEAGDLRQRFQSHEKLPCMRLNGATHIGSCFNLNMSFEESRKDAETDLLARTSTPCNQTQT